MKRHYILPFVLFLAAAVFFPPRASAQPAQEGKRFLLFYSNDVRGETEPCG